MNAFPHLACRWIGQTHDLFQCRTSRTNAHNRSGRFFFVLLLWESHTVCHVSVCFIACMHYQRHDPNNSNERKRIDVGNACARPECKYFGDSECIVHSQSITVCRIQSSRRMRSTRLKQAPIPTYLYPARYTLKKKLWIWLSINTMLFYWILS